jgi:uncharacterized membrane protein
MCLTMRFLVFVCDQKNMVCLCTFALKLPLEDVTARPSGVNSFCLSCVVVFVALCLLVLLWYSNFSLIWVSVLLSAAIVGSVKVVINMQPCTWKRSCYAPSKSP